MTDNLNARDTSASKKHPSCHDHGHGSLSSPPPKSSSCFTVFANYLFHDWWLMMFFTRISFWQSLPAVSTWPWVDFWIIFPFTLPYFHFHISHFHIFTFPYFTLPYFDTFIFLFPYFTLLAKFACSFNLSWFWIIFQSQSNFRISCHIIQILLMYHWAWLIQIHYPIFGV